MFYPQEGRLPYASPSISLALSPFCLLCLPWLRGSIRSLLLEVSYYVRSDYQTGSSPFFCFVTSRLSMKSVPYCVSAFSPDFRLLVILRHTRLCSQPGICRAARALFSFWSWKGMKSLSIWDHHKRWQDLWPTWGGFSFPALSPDCPRAHSPLSADFEVGFLPGVASQAPVKQMTSSFFDRRGHRGVFPVDKTVPRIFSSI